MYYFFYYLVVIFLLKIFRGKGDHFLNAVFIVSICFVLNIFTILFMVDWVPTLGRNQMYLFYLPIYATVFIINYFFLYSNSNYRKIFLHYNKLFNNANISIVARLIAFIYVVVSFISIYYIGYLKRGHI